jgi:uncharacterized protein YkwD
MRKIKALRVSSTLAVFMALGAWEAQAGCVDPLASTAPATESRFRVDVCDISNRNRAASKLVALKLDTKLTQMAQAYARDMFDRNFFSHTDPDGKTFAARLKQWKVTYKYAGENIAWGYVDGEDVMQGWMGSSGHRANIMNKNFRKLGVGYSGKYWVQVFTN